MKITICDICGKKMSTIRCTNIINTLNFCISSYGKIWDICDDCRSSLNKWMTIRRAESEDEK